MRRRSGELEGIYALVLMHQDEPQTLVGRAHGAAAGGRARRQASTSSPPTSRPSCPYTRDFLFLDDGDVVTVTPDARHDHRRRRRAR